MVRSFHSYVWFKPLDNLGALKITTFNFAFQVCCCFFRSCCVLLQLLLFF